MTCKILKFERKEGTHTDRSDKEGSVVQIWKGLATDAYASRNAAAKDARTKHNERVKAEYKCGRG
jgi:hypothetical protein